MLKRWQTMLKDLKRLKEMQNTLKIMRRNIDEIKNKKICNY